MKLKKIIIFSFILLFCFMIFKHTFNSKFDYLALGDDLSLGKTPFGSYGKSFTDFFAQYLKNKNKLKSYNNKFLEQNYRITDLIKDMDNNKKEVFNNKKININQAIVNSEIITLSIGINDLFYKLTYNNIKKNQLNTIYSYVDEIFIDYNYLITKIRKLTDCKLYLIGFYNPLKNINNTENKIINKLFYYIDEKFKKLEQYKKVYYIKINKGFSEKSYYLPNYKIFFPSLEGYNYISNIIIKSIEN